MVMTKLDGACCFPIVLNGNFLLMFLADFQKAHINKRLKQDLAFHFIDSNWQLDS